MNPLSSVPLIVPPNGGLHGIGGFPRVSYYNTNCIKPSTIDQLNVDRVFKAGNTVPTIAAWATYPRTRGLTWQPARGVHRKGDLSPPAWVNLVTEKGTLDSLRPIPARVG